MTRDTRHRPDRRMNDAYREAARIRDKARYERLKADPEYQAKARERAKRMREQYPQKASARLAVRRALERGDLVAKPCAVCGNAEAQAHHENYDLPLEVVWLCVPHHAERHRQLRAHSEARV